MLNYTSPDYNHYKKHPLVPPNNKRRVLLHTCCAPCCGEVIQAMLASSLDITLYFYNPNIHPKREYELRKADNIAYATKYDIPFVDADYDKDEWFLRVKGLEKAPERGERCTKCFDMRFERSALYAHEHGFDVFTSSLGISRWKDMDQINRSGTRAADRYPSIDYWTYNWRKKGGASRMYDIAKEESFYKQEYCGCIFSLIQTNAWRKKNHRPEIDIGNELYQFNP